MALGPLSGRVSVHPQPFSASVEKHTVSAGILLLNYCGKKVVHLYTSYEKRIYTKHGSGPREAILAQMACIIVQTYVLEWHHLYINVPYTG